MKWHFESVKLIRWQKINSVKPLLDSTQTMMYHIQSEVACWWIFEVRDERPHGGCACFQLSWECCVVCICFIFNVVKHLSGVHIHSLNRHNSHACTYLIKFYTKNAKQQSNVVVFLQKIPFYIIFNQLLKFSIWLPETLAENQTTLPTVFHPP